MTSRRWIEIGTLCVLLAGSAWLGQLVHHNYVVHADGGSGPMLAPAHVPAVDGDGVAAPLVLVERSRPLLMLVMSTECPYCEANMPNWRSLAERIDDTDGPEIVVLSVSDAAATRAFLERHGLEVPFRVIDSSALELLGIDGYPGTVAFHPEDRVLRDWAGVLDDADQEAVAAWARTPWKPRRADAD
jgi:hypothetical protein